MLLKFYVLWSQKFSPFSLLALMGKKFYPVVMIAKSLWQLIFTAWAKIYSTKYFYNARVGGLGEIFVKQNFWLYGIYVHVGVQQMAVLEG